MKYSKIFSDIIQNYEYEGHSTVFSSKRTTKIVTYSQLRYIGEKYSQLCSGTHPSRFRFIVSTCSFLLPLATNLLLLSGSKLLEGYKVVNKRNVTIKFKNIHSIMANINLGKDVANKK